MLSVCPLCGSNQFLPTAETRADFELVVCAGCGLAGNRRMPDEAEQLAFYESDYRVKPLDRGYLVGELCHAVEVLTWLGERLQPGTRHLDLGCAAGVLLAVTREVGALVTGVEVDRHYSTFARERLGLTVHGEPHQSAPLEPGGHDLLSCAHVLEHVWDPVRFLADALPPAAPEAWLYLEVPNLDRPWHWKTADRFFGPHHNWYFSADRLAATLATAGWNPIVRGVSRRDGSLVVLAQPGPADAADYAEDPADVVRRTHLARDGREPWRDTIARKRLRAAQKRTAVRDWLPRLPALATLPRRG